MKKSVLFLVSLIMLSGSSALVACNDKNAKPTPQPPKSEQEEVQSDFAFTEKSLSLYVGNNVDLAVKGLAESERIVSFTSNNAQVASVTSAGKVEALSAGKATIKAVTNLGNQALIVINVASSEAIVPVISVDSDLLELQVGDNFHLNYSVSFIGEKVSATVALSSSNSSICSVENGVIHAISVGECYITAQCEYDGKPAQTVIKVTVSSAQIAVATSYENATVNYQDGISLSIDTTFAGQKVQVESLTFSVKDAPNGVSVVNGNFLKTDGCFDGGVVTVVASFAYDSVNYSVEKQLSVVGRPHILFKNVAGGEMKEYYFVGQPTRPPVEPVMNGYVFNGWYDDNGVEYAFDEPFEESFALTAHWAIVEHKDFIYQAKDLLKDNKVVGFGNNGIKDYEWDYYFKDPQGVGYVYWVEYYQNGGKTLKISIPVLDNERESNSYNFGLRREGQNGDTWTSFKINGVEVSSYVSQTPLFTVENNVLKLRNSSQVSIDLTGKTTIDLEFKLGATVKVWVSEYHGKTAMFDYRQRMEELYGQLNSVNSFSPKTAYDLKSALEEFDSLSQTYFTEYEKAHFVIDDGIRQTIDNSCVVKYSYSLGEQTISSSDYYFTNEQLELPELSATVTDKVGLRSFLGWFDGEDKFLNGGKVTGDLDLVARYEITEYTNYVYTYNVDGALFDTSTYHYQDSVVPVAEPTKDGYIFVGWENEQGRTVSFNKPVEDSGVFNAIFKRNSEYFLDYPSDIIDLHTELQLDYLYDEYSTIANYANGSGELSRPLSVTFTWNTEKFSNGSDIFYYVFRLGNDEALQNYYDHKVFGNSVELQNLEVSTHYYYKVIAVYENETTVESTVQSFTTKGNVRNISIEGVANVRDLGGKTLDGGNVINQGLIYRGGRLNTDGTATPVAEIKDSGIEVFKNQLGIKTEIDFRGASEVGGLKGSSIIAGVNYYNVPLDLNNLFYGNDALIKQLFGILSNADNYPVYMHCSIGTDRTGFASFLINGLLGASEEDLYRDYLFSMFGNIGGTRSASTITGYINNLQSYSGSTLSEKIESYLMQKGVTASQIANIKALMVGNGSKNIGTSVVLDEVARIENVVNGIKSIANLTSSDENRAKVKAVREAYNALSANEKARVFNIQVLNAKEEEIAARYAVTFTNLGGDDIVVNDIAEGRTVQAPTVNRSGYALEGWYLNGVKYDFSAPVVSNITITAKWLVIDESYKRKDVYLSAQGVKEQFGALNISAVDVVTSDTAGAGAWFHDSDFNDPTYDKIYEYFVKYYMSPGTAKFTLPQLNVDLYHKIEFGIRVTAARMHMQAMKVNGVLVDVDGYVDNYVFVIDSKQIKVYAVNSYATPVFTTDYNANGENTLELVLSENKTIYVSEMHGLAKTHE